MKRALTLLVALLALAGCTADNNVSVQIFQICAPPEDCTFTGECSLRFIGTNQLDVLAADSFWTFLEIHNQMVDNTDLTSGRPNTRDAYVEEYSIEFEAPGLTAALSSVVRRVESGPNIVPAEGTTVISVLAIPPETRAAIAAAFPAGASTVQVLAKVRLRGFLADQSTFETAEFPIPVEVCVGCFLPVACTDPTEIAVYCPQFGQSPASVSCVPPI